MQLMGMKVFWLLLIEFYVIALNTWVHLKIRQLASLIEFRITIVVIINVIVVFCLFLTLCRSLTLSVSLAVCLSRSVSLYLSLSHPLSMVYPSCLPTCMLLSSPLAYSYACTTHQMTTLLPMVHHFIRTRSYSMTYKLLQSIPTIYIFQCFSNYNGCCNYNFANIKINKMYYFTSW